MVDRTKEVRREPGGSSGIAEAGRAVRGRSATVVAEAFSGGGEGNRRIRRRGGYAGSPGLALLCVAAAGHTVAQVEYRCFGEAALAAKPAESASAALAYRGLDASFSKWQDGLVPVTIDHRGVPEGYTKADYEKLLSSVLEEVEGVADLTFEYRAVPGEGDGELDDEALDAAFENFPGIRFAWEDAEQFGGRADTGTRVRGLSFDEQNAHDEKMQLELGYLPTVSARLRIGVSTFSSYLERNPDAARYLIVHELLHGLGLGHSDNPLSIMHASPYRSDRGGLHADDIAGLQALYGPPDELVLLEVDLGPAPVGVGLDAENSGFLFQTWVEGDGTDEIHVPLNRAGNSAALFHWMGGMSHVLQKRPPRLELAACVKGLPAGSPAAVAVYQTSPPGEVFRYLDSEEEFSTVPPPWHCVGGTALRLPLSHYDYYAAQPGAWRFAIGVNGGLLADVTVDIDTAYRSRHEPTSRGSLAVTRRGDGVFDLEARFADGGGPEGIGFGHDWHIPGYDAYHPWVDSPEEVGYPVIPGVTYIPRGLAARVEFSEPGVREVFAEARKAQRYEFEGMGGTALARGYLVVPRESGVSSLFGEDGEDGFLHVPAVDVSGSALAAALGGAGVDVSGGHLELLLKRTGHAGEQYKLVEARAAAVPTKAAASVSASGQLVLGDVAGSGGMRRSMALAPVPGSNPLRFSAGSPGAPGTDRPTAPPDVPAIPSLPALDATWTVPLSPPARWPLGEDVPVAYVHDYELANFSEAEIREEFFLPALKIIEGAAGIRFRVVDDHDPEDGPFLGILISLASGEYANGEVLGEYGSALRSHFGEELDYKGLSGSWGGTWGVHEPQLGIFEFRAAWIPLSEKGANGEPGAFKEANGVAGNAWDRRQWLRAFVKPIIRVLGVDLYWVGSSPPYLPEPREIEALRALYGPPDAHVHPADVFDPLDFEFVAEDLGWSFVDARFFVNPDSIVSVFHAFEANEDGKIAIDTWRLGSGEVLTLDIEVVIAPGAETINPSDPDYRILLDSYDIRAYLANPAGNITRVYGDDDGAIGVSVGSARGFTLSVDMIIGDLLASSPGTWKGTVTVRGGTFYEFELEADGSHRPEITLNKPPEVELSVDSLGGGRFRLGISAEDAEGDPFLLAWTAAGREPDVQVDLTRTWRENLPEPVTLEYHEPGIYQVFAAAVGETLDDEITHWHSAYIAVPRQSGVASYFPTERILHLPAVQTDGGFREWNLKRVGEGGDGDILFMLMDSRRAEGNDVAAISPDPQTGLFHLDKLLGFGRDCGAARLGEIPDSDPPRLRLSACGTSDANAAPTVNFGTLPAATAYVGLPFLYQVGGNVFSDGDLDELSFSATMADGGELPAWLSFDGERGEFRGLPPAGHGYVSFPIDVTAEDGLDTSPPAQFILRVAPPLAVATGAMGMDSGNIHLPSVGIQPDGGGFQTCITADLSAAAGDISSWTMSYGILPAGCPLSAAENHRMPVIEGHAGAMALSVPLVELDGTAPRLCMAMEFALDGADFQILRLVEVAAVECPSPVP